MSDDDKDVDIESDEDEMIVSSGIQHHTYHSTSPGQPQFQSQAEKRAHHNALERKRRDHIKDSFHSLRDSIPTVHAEKITPKSSRAQILNKATDYIQYMRKKNTVHQQDIEELRKQNHVLEAQVRQLEGLKASMQTKEEKQETEGTNEDNVGVKMQEKSDSLKVEENSDSEPAEGSETRTSRRKKLKT